MHFYMCSTHKVEYLYLKFSALIVDLFKVPKCKPRRRRLLASQMVPQLRNFLLSQPCSYCFQSSLLHYFWILALTPADCEGGGAYSPAVRKEAHDKLFRYAASAVEVCTVFLIPHLPRS